MSSSDSQPPKNGDVEDPSPAQVASKPPIKQAGTPEFRERNTINPRRKLEEFVHELCYQMTHILRRAPREKGGALTDAGRKDVELVKTMMNNGRQFIEQCFQQPMPGGTPPDVPRRPTSLEPATADTTAAIQAHKSRLDPLEVE